MSRHPTVKGVLRAASIVPDELMTDERCLIIRLTALIRAVDSLLDEWGAMSTGQAPPRASEGDGTEGGAGVCAGDGSVRSANRVPHGDPRRAVRARG